jgi:hypothetical protein
MQYILSTECFHFILNKSLVCALINEHKLVIVKTNQENPIVFRTPQALQKSWSA